MSAERVLLALVLAAVTGIGGWGALAVVDTRADVRVMRAEIDALQAEKPEAKELAKAVSEMRGDVRVMSEQLTAIKLQLDARVKR